MEWVRRWVDFVWRRRENGEGALLHHRGVAGSNEDISLAISRRSFVSVMLFIEAQDAFNHGQYFGSALHTPRIMSVGTCTSNRIILLWQRLGCRRSQPECFEFLVQHRLS